MPGQSEASGPALRAVYAPGKLVLLGEYAVLDGAPALVLAIDAGVRCEVFEHPAEVRIHTPDGDTRFVAPALRGAPPGLYRFSPWNPVSIGPHKPGFGGSAAATVAACLAGGRPVAEAAEIHRRVQGSGSGVDVAASTHGGLIRFQAGTVTTDVTDPSALHLVVSFSGQSARTGPRVQQYLAWSPRDAFVRAMTGAVDRFALDPVAALAAGAGILQAMAQEAGIAYLSPGLQRAMDIARDCGGAAKPSGAGGGDCAVALFPSGAAAEAYRGACAGAGLTILDVRPSGGAAVAMHPSR